MKKRKDKQNDVRNPRETNQGGAGAEGGAHSAGAGESPSQKRIANTKAAFEKLAREQAGYFSQVRFTNRPGEIYQWGEPARQPRMDEEIDSERAPDLIEPVLAWRGWEVTPTGHLTSSGVSGGIWDPGVNRAVCIHAEHTEDVPAVNCACGFYGWHEPADIQHGQIKGAIKCWGEIIVHDVGIRAEYAEIVCLFANQAHEAMLARAVERYLVPIVKTQEEAEALAGVEGIRVPEEMRPEKPKKEPSVNPYRELPQWHKFEIAPHYFEPPKWTAKGNLWTPGEGE